MVKAGAWRCIDFGACVGLFCENVGWRLINCEVKMSIGLG